MTKQEMAAKITTATNWILDQGLKNPDLPLGMLSHLKDLDFYLTLWDNDPVKSEREIEAKLARIKDLWKNFQASNKVNKKPCSECALPVAEFFEGSSLCFNCNKRMENWR